MQVADHAHGATSPRPAASSRRRSADRAAPVPAYRRQAATSADCTSRSSRGRAAARATVPITHLPAARRRRCRAPRTARRAAGSRGRARAPRRGVTKTSDVSTTPSSTRPDSATISRTRRRPSGPVAACTTRSTDEATVGTMYAAVTFSPASIGSTQSLVTASRAELACTLVMPGMPEFSATSRSSASAWRTSPTTSRCRAHPQRLDDETPQRDLARALEADLPGLHRHPVGSVDADLEDLLARHDALVRGHGVEQARQQGRLACLGATGHDDVETGDDRRP